MIEIIKKQKKSINLFILIKHLHIAIILLICLVLNAYSETLNNATYTYYSNEIAINLYNTLKSSRFQLKAEHIQYFSDSDNIWFKKLEIIIFNKKNIPIWNISCDEAQLINQELLDLCGYVYINKIVNNKYIESVITKRVLVNLADENIISDNKTIIHGHCFYSISSNAHVYLKTHIIKLFGEIYTQYEFS